MSMPYGGAARTPDIHFNCRFARVHLLLHANGDGNHRADEL
jgi:hypothetical protein